MFNVNFLPQIQAAARHLFGNRGEPPERINNPGGPPDAATSARYMPPPGVKTVPCHPDTNGEWVPDVDIFDRPFGDFIRVTDLPLGKAIVAAEEKHGVSPGLKEYHSNGMTITYYGDPPPQEFIDKLYSLAEAEGWTLIVQTMALIAPSRAMPALE